MSVAVVVVAAGSGERLGAGLPKALVGLAGSTILDWSLRPFTGHADVGTIVVVAPEAACEELARVVPTAIVVAGGDTRQESVRCGLAALGADVEFVLVHDAARPLVPVTVVSAVIDALRSGADAVIPVLEVADTIKRVDEHCQVLDTVDRSRLRRVQTPQGFRLSVLRDAHAIALRNPPSASTLQVTDDAGLVEAIGRPVLAVRGDEAAFKITTPYDLRLAELLASR